MKTSAVVQDGGRDPYFGGEEILLWMDGSNWLDDVVIKYGSLLPPAIGIETGHSLIEPLFAVVQTECSTTI